MVDLVNVSILSEIWRNNVESDLPLPRTRHQAAAGEGIVARGRHSYGDTRYEVNLFGE